MSYSVVMFTCVIKEPQSPYMSDSPNIVANDRIMNIINNT